MLSTLPAELLLSIASYIDSRVDILRLAACCRAFYALLLPKVFTLLDLTEHRNSHLSLVHTLASQPALAQEVRNLRVSSGWRPTTGVRSDQEVMLPVLKSALGPDANLSTWDRELQSRGNDNAWTVLLLALLPNLEDLVLKVDCSSNYILEWMAKVARKESSGLSKLRNFTVICVGIYSGFNSSQVLPILRLPSLRSFGGHMIRDAGSSDEDLVEDEVFDAASYVPDNVGYSNVTHIHLKSCCSRRGFADLIGAPKCLESLIFEHSDDPNYVDDDVVMYASRYYPPLCRHRETLQTITLTDDDTNHHAPDYYYTGSFAEFSALRELRLHVSHAIDWNQSRSDLTSRHSVGYVLPPSLEILILDGLEKKHLIELAKALKDLLLGEKYRCAYLTYLEVNGIWMHVQQSTEESNARPRPIPAMLEVFADFKVELEFLCSAVGVGFRLRDVHVEDIIKRNRSYGFWSD